MLEWLAIWGVVQTAKFLFKPILEDLAKDVAKDMAKSYVAKCFKSVFSPLHRNPLTKATGLAVKELLVLIEDELRDADLDDEQLNEFIPDIRQFIQHKDVQHTIGSLFLEPGAAKSLDPAVFAHVWQRLKGVHTPPDGFDWQRITKRFARKVTEIRETSGELKETFESLAKVGDSEALREIAGLPPEFDLEKYREALFERHRNLDFGSLDTTGAYYSGVRLWSVFVPQSIRECHEYTPQLLELPKEHLQRLLEKGELDAKEMAEAEKMQDLRRREYVSQPLQPVLEVVDDSAIKRNIILGDPGSGKSSLLRFLALRWARIEDANLRYTQPLPLLIELRDYNRWECASGKSFPRYLHEASTWHQLNQQTLDHLLKQPDRVVLLLDGLDEVFDPAQRQDVVNDIQRFSNKYKHVRIVLTSRVVGYQPHRLRDAEFRHFMLQDLSSGTAKEPGQIDAFLDKWHDVTFDNKPDAEIKRERLRKAIHDSKPIAMLAGNPLLLTMMAILNRHQELPRDRVELYQQATRVLLQQWDTERALGDFPELRGQVDLRAKTAILRSIANHMQSATVGLAGNIIDGETLTSLIEDYLLTELHFDQARAAAAAVVRQLHGRNFMLCDLGADSYAFVHRTFLEYFCAADFVHRFNIEKSMTSDDLIGLFDKHCRDDDWREVLRLIGGQIDEQFVCCIVEHLVGRVALDRWVTEECPEIPLAIYLLNDARSPNKMTDCGAKAALRIFGQVRYGGHGGYYPELEPAVKEIGFRWPGIKAISAELDDWTGSVAKLNPHFAAVSFWPFFLAHIVGDRDLVCKAASSSNFGMRVSAFEMLAEKWADKTTEKLFAKRTRVDDAAAMVFAGLHSEFGRIVLRRDVLEWEKPLYPAEPISAEQIEKAAGEAHVPPDEIDETVRSLSAHMGWDITKGSAG